MQVALQSCTPDFVLAQTVNTNTPPTNKQAANSTLPYMVSGDSDKHLYEFDLLLSLQLVCNITADSYVL